jgi:hypothetical protein
MRSGGVVAELADTGAVLVFEAPAGDAGLVASGEVSTGRVGVSV